MADWDQDPAVQIIMHADSIIADVKCVPRKGPTYIYIVWTSVTRVLVYISSCLKFLPLFSPFGMGILLGRLV